MVMISLFVKNWWFYVAVGALWIHWFCREYYKVLALLEVSQSPFIVFILGDRAMWGIEVLQHY